MTVEFNSNQFGDYVAAHGFGLPTVEGTEQGRYLITECNNDYATAAAEIVYLGLTE